MTAIVDRWLVKDVLTALGMILFVIGVILMANLLVRILGQVAIGGLDQSAVWVLVGLELAKVSGFMVPPAFFLAVLLVLGRLHRDNEMIALAAAGVGPARMYRAIAVVALPLAILVTWLVMQVLPWARDYSDQLKRQHSTISDFKALRGGRFNEYQKGNLVVFAVRVDDAARLSRVFVQHRQHGKVGLVFADKAQLKRDLFGGQDYIVLTDGKRYEGRPGNGEFKIGMFEEYGFRISLEERITQRRVPQSAKSWQDLLASGKLTDRAEFEYRLAFPLAVLALVLVANALVRSRPRSSQGLYWRLVYAVFIYFVFLNLLRVGQEWMEEEVTPRWIGVWWVPALFAALAIVVTAIDSLWFQALWNRYRVRAR